MQLPCKRFVNLLALLLRPANSCLITSPYSAASYRKEDFDKKETKYKIKPIMDFIEHLQKALNNRKLEIGVSKVGDWFALLSLQQMRQLSEMLDRVQNRSKPDTNHIAMLVHLLCQLEGFDLFEKYKNDITEPVELFATLVSLEILRRSDRVRFRGTLSFDEDRQMELTGFAPPRTTH